MSVCISVRNMITYQLNTFMAVNTTHAIIFLIGVKGSLTPYLKYNTRLRWLFLDIRMKVNFITYVNIWKFVWSLVAVCIILSWYDALFTYWKCMRETTYMQKAFDASYDCTVLIQSCWLYNWRQFGSWSAYI